MPFCSERCRQIDLGRWLSEAYVVPGRELEPDEWPEEPEPRQPGTRAQNGHAPESADDDDEA